MSTRTTSAKFRGLSGLLDQVFSSLSNGLIVYAVAVVSTAQYFGLIAVQLTLLSAALGCLRGALGTRLLLSAGHDIEAIRREGRYALTAALLISPVLAGAMWLVNTGSGTTTALIAAATPIVLLQDVMRYVVIAEGRPHIAAIWDGVWFLGSFVLLVCTWLNWQIVTVNFLLSSWAALALAAMLGLAASVRIAPAVRGFGQWLGTNWQDRLRYGVDSGLEQLSIFLMLFVIASLVSPVVTAALRGATALLAPISMLTSSLPLIVIPDTARRLASPPEVWRRLFRIVVPGGVVTMAGALVVLVIPDSWGTLLLGNSFGVSQQIIVLIALQYTLAWGGLACMLWLKTFNRSADLLTLKIGYVIVVVGLALGAAFLFGTATAIAAGMVIGATLLSTVSLAWFTPWRERDHPMKETAGSPMKNFTDSARHRVQPVWQDLVIRAGRFTPQAVPDFVRLNAQPAGRPGVSSLLLAIWVFAIMGIFGPLTIVASTGPAPNLSWLGPYAVTLIAAARFAWIMGLGERRLFESMFWAFTYPFMGLAPMTEIRKQQWPIIIPRSDFTLAWAGVAIVLVGTLAFLLGVVANRSMQKRRRHGGAPASATSAESQAEDEELRHYTVQNKRILVLAAGAILMDMYFSYKVGVIQFAQTREQLQAKLTAAFPASALAVVVLAGTYMSLLTAWVSLARFRREAKVFARLGSPQPAGTMRLNLLLLWVVGLLLANTMNPIANARYLSGTAMLAAAAAFGLFATAARFRVAIIGFLTALLLVFPAMDYFRYFGKGNFSKVNPLNAFVSPDYDSFGNIVNGYLIAEREGIHVGRQFVGVILFWVPRALWTDKPVDTGIYLAQSRGYSVVNLSGPLWIEMYLNGGFVVLILAMFALGYFLHGWDTRLDRQLSVFKMPSILGSILPFYMFILLRGSLLQAMPFLVVTVVCWLFVRAKGPLEPVDDDSGFGQRPYRRRPPPYPERSRYMSSHRGRQRTAVRKSTRVLVLLALLGSVAFAGYFGFDRVSHRQDHSTATQSAAPTQDPIFNAPKTLLVISDSMGAQPDAAVSKSYPEELAKMMNWNLVTDVVGGRGYVETDMSRFDRGPVAPAIDSLKYDAENFRADYIIVDVGRNDLGGKDPAVVVAAADNYLTQLRSYYPKAKIVVMVPAYINSFKGGTYELLAGPMRESAEKIGAYVLEPIAEDWYAGDVTPYLFNDDIHLNDAGAVFYADRIARDMRRLGVVPTDGSE